MSRTRVQRRLTGTDPVKRFKVTNSVLEVMAILSRTSRFQSMKEVRLQTRKARVIAHVERHLDNLTAKGWVEREWDIRDRLYRYALNDAGRDMFYLLKPEAP